MLHEIFKGMDNAAEMIDENFKAVGQEIGSNENGEWIKFSNGWQICRHENLTLDFLEFRVNPNDSILKLWEFPVLFVGKPSVTAEIGFFEPASLANKVSASMVTTDNYSATIRYTLNEGNSFSEGNYLNVSAIAIGRWK